MVLAVAQASINRGSGLTGTVAARFGDNVQLSGSDTTGWTSALWQIIAYPEGWTPASGWTLNSETQAYEATDLRPTSFQLSGTAWGKWEINLTVNGTLTDYSLRVEVVSPVLHLHGTSHPEMLARSGYQGFARDVNRNWRLLEDALARALTQRETIGDYQTVQAVTATPGWYVSGAFRASANKTIKLRLVGCVSSASLTMRARLFDVSSTPPAVATSPCRTASTRRTSRARTARST